MTTTESIMASWRELVARYQRPSTGAAITQICNTFLPLVGLMVLMYWALKVHYLLVLLLAIPTAGLLLRVFIMMHDCGHGSFFASRRWNDIVGFVTGVLTFTPYVQWRRDHAIHHATSGNLDKRGYGDVSTLTVREYLALSWWGRLGYRLYRHPVIMFGLGPLWLAVKQRWPTPGQLTTRKERISVYATDLVLVALGVVGALLGVLDEVVLIYLPAFLLAAGVGIWLFYVQHQFEEAYWQPAMAWSYEEAALQGSTYLKLPKVLQWFTGNIGLHHIHHLSPRIPNYRLQQCHDAIPLFHDVPTITLREGIKAIWLKLFDEDNRRMVGFGYLRRLRRQLRSS